MKFHGRSLASVLVLWAFCAAPQSRLYATPQSGKDNASEQLHLVPFRGAATGKVGYIDSHGTVKILPSLKDCGGVDAGPQFSEGRAVAGCIPLGYADATGKIVIPAEFDDAQPFSQGLAAVRDSSQKWGYINKTGKIVIPASFENAGSFSEGLAPVANEDDRWGYIDASGRVQIPFNFEKAGNFSQGLAPVAVRGKYGFADKTGKLAIPAQFTEAKSFSEGLAAVLKGSWHYIDRSGEYAFPEAFEQADGFGEGLAPVRLKGKQKFVYITHVGAIGPPQQFEQAFPFKNGLALVYLGVEADPRVDKRRKLKYGYIDNTGRAIFSAEISYVQPNEGSRGLGSDGQAYLPMTAVTIESVPSGAKVYLVPLDDWESDKNLDSEKDKFLRYLVSEYTPLKDYQVIQQVYRVFFDLSGKRVVRQFDVNEHSTKRLELDFQKE